MQRTTHGIIALALVTLSLSACRDSQGPRASSLRPSKDEIPVITDPNSDSLYRIAASTTDPDIDYETTHSLQNAEHYVWLTPSAAGNAKLLVFLPGATFRPGEYQLVEKEASRLGYHVIGLMYQNDKGVDALCKTDVSESGNCSELMRWEILTGKDSSGLTNVTPANSIDNRLTKLLVWLSKDENHADEGWSRFLEIGGDGNLAPKSSQIAVAGHSQGAGEAAFIAKLRHVDRVVMFAGPPERSDAHRLTFQVDPWIAIGQTPVSKYFAMYHSREPLALPVVTPTVVYVSNLTANLTVLGMFEFGVPALANDNTPPYEGTHILFTDLPPTVVDTVVEPKRNHRSTSMDAFTPMGPPCSTDVPSVCTPKLLEAWRYLLR